jgi:DNA-binding LytR/AlgR family response regulator
MAKLFLILSLLYSLTMKSEQIKFDSLSDLIKNTENNLEKAKLLIKRSKNYSTTNNIDAYNDAALALELSKKDNDVSTQVDAYNLLSGIFSRKDEYQKALSFDFLALSLSDKENYIVGKLNSYKSISRNQKSLGNIKEAILSAEKAKQIAIENKITQDLASINNNLGVIYRSNNQFQESLTVFDEGISQTKNKKLLALLLMNKANTLTELMRLDESIDYLLQSLKINEELKEDRGKLQVYNNLGVVFKKANQFEKSIYYYRKSLKIAEANKIESSTAIGYDNLATVYDLAEKKDSITWFRKKSIAIFEDLKDEKNTARSYHNLGNYQLLHDNLVEAEKNLTTALNKRIKINAPFDIASTKIALSVLYDKQELFEKGETALLEAKTLLKNIASDKKEDLLKALANHYKVKGDLERAFLIKEQQLELKDSLLHDTEILNVVNKENNYVLTSQKKEIQKLQTIEKKFITNKIVYGILIFFVFLLALYSFIRWKKSDFNKKKIQLEKLNIEHQKELVEQENSTIREELVSVKKMVFEDHIILKNKAKIYLNELIYIKSDDHYLEIFTKDKKEFLRGTIKEISAQLPPNFKQSHRSFIVNINFIQTINTSEIVLKSSIFIPLTRKYKDNF